MAKRFRLREIEQVRGNLHEVILPLVNAGGQAQAARELGVTQATISAWLSANGYIKVVRYVREDKAS